MMLLLGCNLSGGPGTFPISLLIVDAASMCMELSCSGDLGRQSFVHRATNQCVLVKEDLPVFLCTTLLMCNLTTGLASLESVPSPLFSLKLLV